MSYPKSLVIIPTYNEKENILLIMPAILEQNSCLEILVVDDGVLMVRETWCRRNRKRTRGFT